MRTTSLASVAMASIAAIAITVPLAAQGTPPAPPAPPPPPAGVMTPRAPEPPRPPRAPMPGERVRVLRRFADDSAMRNRATLGMTLAPTGSVRDTIGVFVMRVAPGGPAERAGIIEGDRIVSIDGVSLKVNPADVDDAYAAGLPVHRVSRTIEKLTPGKTVTLRVYGNGRYRDVTVTTGRAADVCKNRPYMIFSMDDAMAMPALAAIGPALESVGPALESVGPALERVGPMLERMGPMIDESVRGALRELPRHIDVQIDDDSVPPPPPSAPDHSSPRAAH